MASHNYPHIRKGGVKPQDVGTGQLVKTICKKTGTWGIISTDVQLDPNWYTSSPFRKKVKGLIKDNAIKYVLDIHGRRENYPHLLEILPNTSLSKLTKDVPNSFHLRRLSDNEQLTLSEDLNNNGIACAEIEIRKDGRIKNTSDGNYNIAIKELMKLIRILIGEQTSFWQSPSADSGLKFTNPR